MSGFLPRSASGLRPEPADEGHPGFLGAGDGRAASTWRPRAGGRELPGVTVTSLTLAHGPDDVRVHLVTGAASGTLCDTAAGRSPELRRRQVPPRPPTPTGG